MDLKILLILTYTCALAHVHAENLPKIKVVPEPSSGVFTEKFSDFQNETLLIVTKQFSGTIYVRCEASYPVMWTLESTESDWITRITTERGFHNISDPYSYNFSMILTLNRDDDDDVLGNKFECHKVGKPKLLSSLIIAFDSSGIGPTSPVWYYGGSLGGNISWYPNEKKDIIIPCFPLKLPDSFVKLQRVVNETLLPLENGEILKFESFIGFYLNPSFAVKYENLSYACTIHNFEDNTVVSTTDTFMNNDSLESKNFSLGHEASSNSSFALFSVKKGKQKKNVLSLMKDNSKLYCCTSDTRITPLGSLSFTEFPCRHPLRCLNRKAIWDTTHDNGYMKELNDTCIQIDWSDKITLKTTTSQLPLSYYTYCTDEQTYPRVISKGILVGSFESSVNITIPKKLFLGQNVSMACFVNSFFFSKGGFWELEWKNKTIHSFPGTALSHDSLTGEFLLDSLELVRIGCKVPVWNTSDWYTHNITITNISLPIPPTSPTGATQIIQSFTVFTGQHVVLDCEFDGGPVPHYNWKQDKNPQIPGAHSKKLEIWVEDPSDSFAIFECRANNSAGSANKIFNLTIKASITPVITGKHEETTEFIDGDTNRRLICSIEPGTGIPIPEFYWTFNDDSASEVEGLEVTGIEGQESYLNFKEVKMELNGEYCCNVGNLGGLVRKLYSVRVIKRFPIPPWLCILLTTLTVLGIILFGLFLIRARKQKDEDDRNEYSVEFQNLPHTDSFATVKRRT